MCKTQCVLALLALYVGLAHSWDIAVSVGNQLIFYTDGIRTNTVVFISHNLTALAYDEVHNMMLYVDKQSNNDAVCGYNLFSKENNCFIKRVGSNIHSIAFDPATDTLFFTDTNERSINWISLKPGSNKNVDGNLLMKMDYLIPTDIAVDSCRGHIYWANTDFIHNEYMERARFNGSNRKVIHRYMPVTSMAMDPQTRNVYFIDGNMNRFLSRKNLDDQMEDKSIILYDTDLSNIKDLTVSNCYLYWMNSSENYKTVWQMPKNMMSPEEIKEICRFYNETPLAVAANYKIKDQIQGLQDCGGLSSLIPTNTITSNCLDTQDTTKHTTESTKVVEFCVHGIKVSETSVCKCTPGYSGGRCDYSVCENYCLQGDCSFNHEGLPKCRCNAGYSGERCEVYACHGYCLNNGDCSLNDEDQPVCQCVGNHEGTRCETANTPTFDSEKSNLTIADILSNWRKHTSKVFIAVEV